MNKLSTSVGTEIRPSRDFALWLALLCVLPSLLGLMGMSLHFYFQERTRMQQDQILTARALVQAVDRELNTVLLVAQGLARSPLLTSGNLATFDEQARLFLRDEFPGINFVVHDLDSVQRVNTLRPFGASLPDPASRDFTRRVMETGEAVISDVFIGGVLKRPVMAVAVPVFSEGKVVYTLSVGLLPEKLGQVLLNPRLPSERVVSILDRNGVIAARTRESEEYVGQKSVPAIQEAIRDFVDGSAEVVTREGMTALAMFARSMGTGWTVAIEVPAESIVAEALYSLKWIALWLLGINLVVYGLALKLARRHLMGRGGSPELQ